MAVFIKDGRVARDYLFGMKDRQFVCYFHFVGWSCFSLGLHFDAASPNFELHIPFGFIRVGWQGVYRWRDLPSFGKRRVDD